MKLFARIVMTILCSAVLSAPAQTATAPKKSTEGAKSDSSFKEKMSKLTDEFDYFAKSDTIPPKIDTSSPNFAKFLDEFLSQDNNAPKKNNGQKDKTLDWKQQNGNTDVWVTTASSLSNTDHYSGFVIKPGTAKILHLNITGSLFLKNTTYNPAYVRFFLQVKNLNTIFVNELVETGKKTINIPLPSTDSVAIYFIAHPGEKDTVDFHCDWSIGDTAAYSYAGQQPEVVFDKMLELAPNQFTNIHTDKFGGNANIEYPEGLFAPLHATRSAFYTHVTQYTAKKLATGQAADKINAEWNKKITAWLKEYNVTDIKKTESGDRSKNSDTEITTYTKYDARGKFLFSVKVFKEQDGGGTEDEPVWWNTGVSIY